MTEKKYLLTESDLREISDEYNADYEMPLMKCTEWLEAHEYHEPTCRDKGIGVFMCSRCGAFARRDAVMDCCGPIPIRHCPNCGARVVGGT